MIVRQYPRALKKHCGIRQASYRRPLYSDIGVGHKLGVLSTNQIV